ncbi:hypothetical protein K9L97_01660 [Candidatus Woesearchaeota archaeon]|nr:hypothetical protein [Candidatus Woesearchaeota archaeon]
MTYKVLITTSGIGSRLGELTKYTNKALVRIGKKPALSYIIENYPKSTPLVITVGYYANQVEEFCKLAYPDRDITFVTVDKYEGPGTSLAYSMLQAKNELQCPFIFHAADTIIDEELPNPETDNWVAGYKLDDSSQYASFVTQKENVTEFLKKGASDYDYIHIGLVGISDFSTFWKSLESVYKNNPEDSSLNDISGIEDMISKGAKFKYKSINKWYDIGNIKALNKARDEFPDKFEILEKIDETLFIFDDKVIKFFYDKKIVSGRLKRAKILGNLVPKIIDAGEHFYSYEFIEGDVLAEFIDTQVFKKYLHWLQKNLFVDIDYKENGKFVDVCDKFYRIKTNERIIKFYEKHKFKDETDVINGIYTPPLKNILSKIDFSGWLNQGVPIKFHGDLHFENTLITKDSFLLLDWRQNFGGLFDCGDLYYDLAKLYHGMIVNHGIVKKDLYTIENTSNGVKCDILRPQQLVECEKIYLDFLEENNYDIKKVKVLTALIYLNIAPLHHHPYDKFLYYFGKLMLYENLEK